MRFRRSGRPAHSRSSRAARSPGSAMAMTAANRSSSFIGLVLRLTQRNRRAESAVEQEKFAILFQVDRAVPSYFTALAAGLRGVSLQGFALSAFVFGFRSLSYTPVGGEVPISVGLQDQRAELQLETRFSTRTARWSDVPRESTDLFLLLDNTWFKSCRQLCDTNMGPICPRELTQQYLRGITS